MENSPGIKVEKIREQYTDLEKKDSDIIFTSLDEIIDHLSSPTGTMYQLMLGLKKTKEKGYKIIPPKDEINY